MSAATLSTNLNTLKHEQFQQDAMTALQEYQATGLHVTLEEADAWLAKLEAGIDEEPPACHV
jgi:predicted transcriptional regulator